jgi:flagellar protein FliL
MKQTEIDLLPARKAPEKAVDKKAVDKSEDDPFPEESAAPKSKKKILMLGAAGLVILGGGFAAAAYFGILPVSIPGISPKQEGEKVEKASPPDVSVGPMVKIKSLVLNLRDERKRNMVKISVVMEVAKPEWAEEVAKRIPVLTDIMILTFSDMHIEELKTPDAKEKLKKKLLANFNQALDSEKIRSIYFDEFLYQ